MTDFDNKILPRGWTMATISDLVGLDGVFADGDWVESKDQDPEGDVRLVQLADIGDGRYLNRSSRFLTREKADELRCTFLECNDVLVARMPDPLGRACIFSGDQKQCVTVVDVCIIRTGDSGPDHRWLVGTINAPQFRWKVAALQRGSTRKRISRRNLATIALLIPPLPEQQRIVAEIEKHFTRLDAAVAALKRVRANLKRYRASVLKAACEGRLVPTEAELAQAEGRDYEPADVLLQRILKERRARWEADELAKMQAKGKPPKDDRWKAKYKEPEPPDTSELPDLPEGWVWVGLETVAAVIDPHPSHRTPPEVEGGVPYVGMGDIDDAGRIDLDHARKVSQEVLDEHRARYQLKVGDIIFGKIGTLGEPAKLTKPFNYCLSANVILIQPQREFIEPGFVFGYLASPLVTRLLAAGRRATTQAAFGIQRARIIPLPFPPFEEQRRIVEEVERRLSVIDGIEAQVEANLKRAEHLRQAILKRAFEGKLVPQDPDDEPASVLLERIRAERETAAVKSNGRQKRAATNGKRKEKLGGMRSLFEVGEPV